MHWGETYIWTCNRYLNGERRIRPLFRSFVEQRHVHARPPTRASLLRALPAPAIRMGPTTMASSLASSRAAPAGVAPGVHGARNLLEV